MDRNFLINILLLTSTAVLSSIYSLWFLLTPVVFHIINDLLHWAIGFSVFNTDVMVQRAYGLVDDLLTSQIGSGLDLGFNFYEGDLTRDRKTAQKKKWEYMFEQLNLKPGHKLMDIGCGYGDWLKYARSRGVEVEGINLTKEQAQHVNEVCGIKVFNINWKQVLKEPKLQEELFGKFDAVTFMDTIEHYVPATKRHDKEYQGKIYSDMFYLASKLIKEESSSGRVFLSCLHQIRTKLTFMELLSVWIMKRTLSGFYPISDHGLTQYSIPYFKELRRVDRTEDYRLTAVIEKEHFQRGDCVTWNLKTLLKGIKWFIIHPYTIHSLLACISDAWMRTYGADRLEKKYDPEKREKVSMIRLWMVTLQKTN